ncbi:MAG: hypothetical protein BWY76_03262 [bacterium ADurb.Bin429]|nr:MAG: hypothetical protein BWY76_03262 [bacterium ADurb.Bin429]
MHVHAGAVLPEKRLGHEGGIDAIHIGDFLHRQAVGHQRIRHGEGVGVAQINLVLTGGDFVMAVFDVNAHLLQRQHRIATQVHRFIAGDKVEITTLVQRFRLLRAAEVKIFRLGPHIEGEAQFTRFLQVTLQHLARVAFVWSAVGIKDIAEHARHRALTRAPGQDGEGAGVGHGYHVAFVNTREAFDGGAVKAYSLLHRLIQFLDRDAETFQEAEDISEP